MNLETPPEDTATTKPSPPPVDISSEVSNIQWDDLNAIKEKLKNVTVSSSNSSKPNKNQQSASMDDKKEEIQPEQGGSAGGSGDASATGGAQSDPWSSKESMVSYLESQGIEQMFAVQPLTWCPHLETVQSLPPQGLDTTASCQDPECGDGKENWVCLVCYKVYCSRFVNEHMLMHGVTEGHLMTLSYSDLSVWCYGCDHYIDNEVLMPAKRSAHQHKFGQDLPGS